MSKSTIVGIVIGVILIIAFIVGFFTSQNRADDAYILVKTTRPITKVEITVISAPNLNQKKVITITDKATLDSLNLSLQSLGTSISVGIAKLNDVYAILDVYKESKKATIEVVNSQYSGWVLLIGNYKFRNNYVFELLQRYL